MTFYQSISNHYDRIFPFNPSQMEFILKRLRGKALEEIKLLDVGCGTGNLSLELADKKIQVTGVDLDQDMIRLAREKTSKGFNNPEFMELSMLKLKDKFKCNHFDIVSCFGNTIAHLKNIREIEYMTRQTAVVTKPDGFFLLQGINYDRILDERIDHLPTISNEYVSFERKYVHLPRRKVIRFDTSLTVRSSGQVFKNSIELYPVRREELRTVLKRSSFIDIRFFGGFDESEYTEKSIPMVISCVKLK